jgi:hypothetical protein
LNKTNVTAHHGQHTEPIPKQPLPGQSAA